MLNQAKGDAGRVSQSPVKIPVSMAHLARGSDGICNDTNREAERDSG